MFISGRFICVKPITNIFVNRNTGRKHLNMDYEKACEKTLWNDIWYQSRLRNSIREHLRFKKHQYNCSLPNMIIE